MEARAALDVSSPFLRGSPFTIARSFNPHDVVAVPSIGSSKPGRGLPVAVSFSASSCSQSEERAMPACYLRSHIVENICCISSYTLQKSVTKLQGRRSGLQLRKDQCNFYSSVTCCMLQSRNGADEAVADILHGVRILSSDDRSPLDTGVASPLRNDGDTGVTTGQPIGVAFSDQDHRYRHSGQGIGIVKADENLAKVSEAAAGKDKGLLAESEVTAIMKAERSMDLSHRVPALEFRTVGSGLEVGATTLDEISLRPVSHKKARPDVLGKEVMIQLDSVKDVGNSQDEDGTGHSPAHFREGSIKGETKEAVSDLGFQNAISRGNAASNTIRLEEQLPVTRMNTEQSKSVKAAWESLVRWSRSWRGNNADNVLLKTTKVAVLGGGSFGTAMAVMLARNKIDMDVVLLMRNDETCKAVNEEHANKKYFPTHRLPDNVRATTDAQEALDGAQFCIHAVPVQSSAEFLRGIAKYVPPTLPIMSVSKGLEVSTLEMMSQLIPRALGNPRQPVAVLSGPSFSIELMDELPTAIVAASKDPELARSAQQLLASRYLRVNTTKDVVGVEMAGALKNVLAIAAGIVEGMQLGNNCMAALVAQGCAEIRWLAEKMGANPATLAGLSGTGDIMLTCFVSLSRNRSVGVRLGSGEKLEDILGSMNQVAEGVATAGAVIALARKYRVQMPVLTAVARILENELTPKKAVLELMSLPQVEER